MAWLRNNSGDKALGGMRRLSTATSATMRWLALPGAAVTFTAWSIATLAGAYSATAPLNSATSFMPRLPAPALASAPSTKIVGLNGKAGRVVSASLEPSANSSTFVRRTLDDRFAAVVASADLSSARLADVFARAGLQQTVAYQPPARERFETHARTVHQTAPAPKRFDPGTTEALRSARLALALSGASDIKLAYADPSPLPATLAFDAVLVTPPEAALDDGLDEERRLFSELPENIPLPLQRPRLAAKPADGAPDKAVATRQAEEEAPAKPAKRTKNRQLAFAKPENPAASSGIAGAFQGLFSPRPKRPRPGVAIYDISAARVYMPDGTVLEAHSGIGKMADNPRYVDQKMKGPTPPGTYNLSMREALFHGVEALRMTPVDGKVAYNRSGILAHSYLLRGGRAESHGCVAFKDYPKFLKAFKQGKVRQIVVVPGSRGKPPATTVAQNGRKA
jgi:hypothetical protein